MTLCQNICPSDTSLRCGRLAGHDGEHQVTLRHGEIAEIATWPDGWGVSVGVPLDADGKPAPLPDPNAAAPIEAIEATAPAGESPATD